MKQFAMAEWERAQRSLASARKLAQADSDSAASRAYYAAFHALTARFALHGQAFTKHSAIRAALHRDLVQPGLLSKENGQAFDFLMDLRETGDYGGIAQVSAESAKLAVRKAEAFMAAVGALCPALDGITHDSDPPA